MKAFDRVYVEFLIQVMERMGFGYTFLDWIRMLHRSNKACFILKDRLTDAFRIIFSVRQGDPIAMILFVIFLEPLLLRIGQLLPGVWVGGARITHETFADDISGLFRSEADLFSLMEVMTRFESISGALVNPSKCWALGLGGQWLQVDRVGIFKFVRELKILGIYLQADYASMLTRNWEVVTTKLRKCLIGWQARVLPTLSQRRDVVEVFGLAKLWYVSQILPMPDSVVEEVESQVGGFLWKGSHERLAPDTLMNPPLKGGLGLTDVRAKADSLLLRTWIRFMMAPRRSVYFESISYWLGFRLRKTIPWLWGVVASFETPALLEVVRGLIVRVIGPIHRLDELGDLTSKVLYGSLREQPRSMTVEAKRLGMAVEWVVVWRRLEMVRGAVVKDRAFRLLHNVLPTRQRLFRTNHIEDEFCPSEGVAVDRQGPVLEGAARISKLFVSGPVQDRTHLFCVCRRTVCCWEWVRNVIVWEILPPGIYVSDEELLLLSFPVVEREEVVVWLVTRYVSWCWDSWRRRTGKLVVREMAAYLCAEYRREVEAGRLLGGVRSLEQWRV